MTTHITKPQCRLPVTRFSGTGCAQGEKTAVRRFEKIPDPVHTKPEFLIKFIIFVSIGVVILSAIMSFDRIESTHEFMNQNAWGSWFLLWGKIFLGVSLAAFLWRLYLVCRYRPAPACLDAQLPVCTVVVPAYNEGQQVLATLKSLAANDYPPEKLKIIAVDDGSADDTWHWIQSAKRELTGRILTIKLPVNRGKRHALYAGFQKSIGEVLVTVDSDSVVDRQTLRQLVSPFVQNQRVGAVAGNVRVLNRHKGIIPRMLDVIFVFSFDFMRASQSMVDTVMCTPGALSAYRRSVVMNVLEEWLGQTFFGKPANIGEDRAMTNLILREGHFVRFQQNAIVYTNVPVGYNNLCRMFLRWARSNIRESIVMSCFIFRRFRTDSMLGARINLILQLLSLTKSQALLAVTLICFVWQPTVFGVNILVGVVIGSSFPAVLYALKRRSSDCLLAYLYGIFWMIGLTWITPFALLTPHKSGWLTRQIKKTNAPSGEPVPAAFPGIRGSLVEVVPPSMNTSTANSLVAPYMLQPHCNRRVSAKSV